MLHSRTLLFIHPIYKSLYLLIPNSHSPSPLATTGLFSMSVSLFLFCRYVHLCRIIDSKKFIIQVFKDIKGIQIHSPQQCLSSSLFLPTSFSLINPLPWLYRNPAPHSPKVPKPPLPPLQGPAFLLLPCPSPSTCCITYRSS